MASLGTLIVDLLLNDADFQKGLRRASRSLQRTGQEIASVGQTLTLGVTLPLVAFGARAAKEFGEFQQVQGQTAAAIASTGGAAKVTAEEVSGLARDLGRLAAVDAEVVQAGENILLTFTKVRNEVGQGNDVFNQASLAALDLSKRMGTDLNAANVLVGKSLNDPVRGLTALTRVGVTFTEQQRAQIKALVRSGDLLGAQKIILGELRTEFGGSAAAAGEHASALTRIGLVFDDLAETVGRSLEPSLKRVAGFIQALADRFQALDPETQDLIVNVALVAAALGPVLVVVGKAVALLGSLAGFLSGATAAWGSLSAAVAAAAASVGLATGPFLLIAAAIAALVVGVVAFGVVFRKEIAAFLERVGALALVRKVLADLREGVAAVVEFVQRVWPEVAKAFEVVRSNVAAGLEALAPLWEGRWRTMVTVLRAAWDVIKGVVRAAWEVVKGVILGGLKALQGDWAGAWAAIKTGLGAAWAEIVATAVRLLGQLADVFRGAMQGAQAAFEAGRAALVGLAQRTYEGIRTWLVDRFVGIVDRVGVFRDRIVAIFRDLWRELVGASIVPDIHRDVLAEFVGLEGGVVASAERLSAGYRDNLDAVGRAMQALAPVADGLRARMAGFVQPDVVARAEDLMFEVELLRGNMTGFGEATLRAGRELGLFGTIADDLADPLEQVGENLRVLEAANRELAAARATAAVAEQMAELKVQADLLRGAYGALSAETVRFAQEHGLLGSELEVVADGTVRVSDRLRALDEAFKATQGAQAETAAGAQRVGGLFESVTAKLGGNVAQVGDEFRGLQEVLARFETAVGDAFAGLFLEGQSLKDSFRSLAQSIVEDLLRVVVQATVVRPLLSSLGGALGGGAGGGLIANLAGALQKRQSGGPVTAGGAFLVGERGPEILVPDTAGHVLPNRFLQGAGAGAPPIVVQQTIQIQTGVAQTVRSEVLNMLPAIRQQAVAAVADAVQRGGARGALIRGD